MTAEGVTPAVTAWAERTGPGARVTGCTTSPLAGGSVARWVERVTLDLANLLTEDSADVARYAATWQRLTGQPLPAGTVTLGYWWAALQISVQYLPWIAGHQPTRDVDAALDRIEQAISGLTQPAR